MIVKPCCSLPQPTLYIFWYEVKLNYQAKKQRKWLDIYLWKTSARFVKLYYHPHPLNFNYHPQFDCRSDYTLAHWLCNDNNSNIGMKEDRTILAVMFGINFMLNTGCH